MHESIGIEVHEEQILRLVVMLQVVDYWRVLGRVVEVRRRPFLVFSESLQAGQLRCMRWNELVLEVPRMLVFLVVQIRTSLGQMTSFWI